jgi:hypothetical protein
VVDVLHRDRAGRSAHEQYKLLARGWRDRVFGRRFGLYFWTIFSLLLILVVTHRMSARWSFLAGVAFGGVVGGWVLMPDALMPDRITRWRNGAWGEQNTKSELRSLKRQGWTIRHDLRWGKNWNHDHVAAGSAVYVLNSKNLKDSVITIEGAALRVMHLDGDDSYLADSWASSVAVEARSLKYVLAARIDFPVHVYPVIVIWGGFETGQAYLGDIVTQEYVADVAVVRGDLVADWLRSRPADLLTSEKQQAVAAAVKRLPRA